MALKLPMPPSKSDMPMTEEEIMPAEGSESPEEETTELSAISDEILIEELKKRGYDVEQEMGE
jgi:hypothetical protein